MLKRLVLLVAVIGFIGGGVAWWILSRPKFPPGFSGGHGRLEAQEIRVTAKYPGRLKTVLAKQGDMVDAGQVVATIDAEPLEQLRASEAKILQAQDDLQTARAQVTSTRAQLGLRPRRFERYVKAGLPGRGYVRLLGSTAAPMLHVKPDSEIPCTSATSTGSN